MSGESEIEVGAVRAASVPGMSRVNMDGATLSAIGALCYGPGWKSPLSRRLGISRGWLREMAEGRQPIPEPTALAMLALRDMPIWR